MPGSLVAAALVVVLATGATLGLLGVLPVGRSDCSRVTIESVLHAMEQSDGYSYRVEGTAVANKLAHPLRTPPADPFDHIEQRIVFEGAYAAPRDWRITLLEGNDPVTQLPPEILLFSAGSSFISVEGELWLTRGPTPVYRTPTEGIESFASTIEPNILLSLAHGLDTEIGFIGDGEFGWQAATEEDGLCRLHGVNERKAALGTGSAQTVTFHLDPGTSFPVRVQTDMQRDADEFDRIDQHLTWSVQAGRPDITPPAAPGPRLLTLDEALAVGRAHGIPDAQVLASATVGDGQVFLVGNEQRVADLMYIGGAPVSTGVGDATPEVLASVQREETGDGAYLVVTVTDPRVATIELDMQFVPDRQVTVDAVPAAFIFEVERQAEVNRFVAFDANGNELPDVNEPD